jgi:hypothetical protein
MLTVGRIPLGGIPLGIMPLGRMPLGKNTLFIMTQGRLRVGEMAF